MGTPASRIIARLGGVPAVAQIAGVDHSTVHRWMYSKDRKGTGGTIPSRHIPALLQAARDRKIRLQLKDFFEGIAA